MYSAVLALSPTHAPTISRSTRFPHSCHPSFTVAWFLQDSDLPPSDFFRISSLGFRIYQCKPPFNFSLASPLPLPSGRSRLLLLACRTPTSQFSLFSPQPPVPGAGSDARTRLLPRRQIGSHTFGLGQTFAHEMLVQRVRAGQHQTVVATLLAATGCARPPRPDREWFLQCLAHKVSGHPAALHALVQGDAEILALFLGPLRVSEIGLGRIHKIEAEQKLIRPTAHPEAVAVVLRRGEILAIRQHHPLLGFRRLAHRCRQRNQSERK